MPTDTTACAQFAKLSPEEQEQHRKKNNPNRDPVGAFTGRCRSCHSADLWDDATWYGCNYCGAWYSQ